MYETVYIKPLVTKVSVDMPFFTSKVHDIQSLFLYPAEECINEYDKNDQFVECMILSVVLLPNGVQYGLI